MNKIQKKYSIGVKVIYNPKYPIGKTNEKYRYKVAVVDNRLHFVTCLFDDGYRIITTDESLSLARIKNQQLEFDFMCD